MPAPTTTFVVDQLRGDILAKSMAKLHSDPTKLPDDFHSVEVEPGVAMLVEPVNEAPYVFVPPNVVHRFESAAGSGTDHLRKRIHATIFFRNLVETAHEQSLRARAAASTGGETAKHEGGAPTAAAVPARSASSGFRPRP